MLQFMGSQRVKNDGATKLNSKRLTQTHTHTHTHTHTYTRRNRRLPNLWGFTDSKWIIRDLDHTFNNSFQDASYVSQPQTCRVN